MHRDGKMPDHVGSARLLPGLSCARSRAGGFGNEVSGMTAREGATAARGSVCALGVRALGVGAFVRWAFVRWAFVRALPLLDRQRLLNVTPDAVERQL